MTGDPTLDDALATVEANAPTGWIVAADRQVRALADSGRPFTADDLWDALEDRPPEPRALGAVLARLSRQGVIVRAGEVKSRLRRGRCTLWTGPDEPEQQATGRRFHPADRLTDPELDAVARWVASWQAGDPDDWAPYDIVGDLLAEVREHRAAEAQRLQGTVEVRGNWTGVAGTRHQRQPEGATDDGPTPVGSYAAERLNAIAEPPTLTDDELADVERAKTQFAGLSPSHPGQRLIAIIDRITEEATDD